MAAKAVHGISFSALSYIYKGDLDSNFRLLELSENFFISFVGLYRLFERGSSLNNTFEGLKPEKPRKRVVGVLGNMICQCCKFYLERRPSWLVLI